MADGNSAMTSRRLLWLATTHCEYSSYRGNKDMRNRQRGLSSEDPERRLTFPAGEARNRKRAASIGSEAWAAKASKAAYKNMSKGMNIR